MTDLIAALFASLEQANLLAQRLAARSNSEVWK